MSSHSIFAEFCLLTSKTKFQRTRSIKTIWSGLISKVTIRKSYSVYICVELVLKNITNSYYIDAIVLICSTAWPTKNITNLFFQIHNYDAPLKVGKSLSKGIKEQRRKHSLVSAQQVTNQCNIVNANHISHWYLGG